MDNLTLEIDQFLRSVEISKTDFFTMLLGAVCEWNQRIGIINKVFPVAPCNSAGAMRTQ